MSHIRQVIATDANGNPILVDVNNNLKTTLEDANGNPITVNDVGQLHVVARGKSDLNNSTEVLLDPAGVFTGVATEILDYSAISILVHSDVESAIRGFVIQYSDDGVDWHDGEQYTIPANITKFLSPPVQSVYYRVIYTNGGTIQTDFHIHSVLKKNPIKWSSHNINSNLNDDDDGELNVSVLKLRSSRDTYVSGAATSTGNFKVSLEEFKNSVSVNSNTQLRTTQFNSLGQEIFKDSSNLDAFGRLRVSTPHSLFDSKQIHSSPTLFWDDQEVSGGGTGSTYSANQAMTTLNVSLNTAGKRVRQTFMRFNYQPGKSQLVLMTGVLVKSGGGAGIISGFGLYDDNNGLFLRNNEGVYQFVRRTFVTGSAVDNPVNQANWNIDTMDGDGKSGITIDFSKTQILIIDFEWLGVGRVRMGFVVDGAIIYAHQFLNANSLTTVYMSTPNLPIRYAIENDGNGAASTLDHICSSVMSEGGTEDLGLLRYKSTAGTHVDCATENLLYAIVGVKLKTTEIDSIVKMLNVSLALFTANSSMEWVLKFNPTVAGTFTYSDLTNSSVQTAIGTATSTVTGGVDITGGFVFSTSVSSGRVGGASSDISNALRLGASIAGVPNSIVLCVRPINGSSAIDVEGSIGWREIS